MFVLFGIKIKWVSFTLSLGWFLKWFWFQSLLTVLVCFLHTTYVSPSLKLLAATQPAIYMFSLEFVENSTFYLHVITSVGYGAHPQLVIAERIKLEVQNWVLMVSISYDCMMYLREESWVLFWANTLMFNQHVNKFLTSWTSSLFCNCLWFSRLGTFPNILYSFPYMYSKLKY